jgi:hypothetical protein
MKLFLTFAICSTVLVATPLAPGSAARVTEQCVAHADPDPNAACVKPLTGCVCAETGNGTTLSLPNCAGCKFTFSGTIDCTYAGQPPTSTPFSCTTTLTCGSASTCGGRCPCTGLSYFPLVFTCDTCP